jgi:hypothetical protein
MDMQQGRDHGQAALKKRSRDMQHGQDAWTCSTHMQHAHIQCTGKAVLFSVTMPFK